MAEKIISPGVFQNESDQSLVQRGIQGTATAIVGPTVKGPVEVPTLVTSYSDYQNRFGTTFESGSLVYSYFTSIAAYNYFANGGNTMLVTRVVSGSAATDWSYSNAQIPAIDASTAVTFEAIDKGAVWNNNGTILTGGALENGNIDNVRWQVVSNNTASGVFSLVVRRGDDTTNNPVILESWNNLSLNAIFKFQ